ncbi:MAG: SHOCT domain-containing protein [Beijerinckiaceae bacterium]
MKPEGWTQWHDQYWVWHMAGHVAWYLFLTFAVVLLAVVVMRWLKHDRGGERAMDLLKERYARGEIAKDDFDRMRKDLLA